MKKLPNTPVTLAFLGGTLLFAVACGDDEAPPVNNNNGGTSTGGTATGGTATGGTATGGAAPTGGTSTGGAAPTGGTAGTPATAGAGGAASGAGGVAGSAGTVGGGAGGVSGGGAAGAGGAGGMGGMMCRLPLPMAGMGGMAGAGGSAAGAGGAGGSAAGAGGAGGAAAGAGGAGGAAAGAGGAAAGAGGAAPVLPRIISTFDTPGSLNTAGFGNWGPGGSPTVPIPDTVVSRNPTEGFSCAGAAELRVPFTAYGTQQDIQINFNPLQNWTGVTMLRAKVKIVMPSTGNLNHLNGVQFAANSKPNYSTFQGHYYNASTFADFAWHDVHLPVPGMGTAEQMLDRTQVIQITVQLITSATAPATGPAAPVTTTLLLDDVRIQ